MARSGNEESREETETVKAECTGLVYVNVCDGLCFKEYFVADSQCTMFFKHSPSPTNTHEFMVDLVQRCGAVSVYWRNSRNRRTDSSSG